jgi:hypothetical protein
VDLDAFYRSALSQGLCRHLEGGRGLVPAALEEDPGAMRPPVPWDVGQRAGSTATSRCARTRGRAGSCPPPEIPAEPGARPSGEARTFGVVLDTSGSMDRRLLGQALGAIASYATARDVPRARVVFCDAAPTTGLHAVEELRAGDGEGPGRHGVGQADPLKPRRTSRRPDRC